MTALTESQHAGEFLVSEAPGRRSREEMTVILGQNLKAGAVLGQITIDPATITSAADAGNTGDGAMGAVTAGAGVQAGRYRLVIIETIAALGTFTVEDPNGVEIGQGNVGTAFSGEIAFTLADGAADFIAGDAFSIDVAVGSLKHTEMDPANTDGSAKAVAVLWGAVDATAADKKGVAIVRDAEINKTEVVFFTGATQPQKDTAFSELGEAGVIGR